MPRPCPGPGRARVIATLLVVIPILFVVGSIIVRGLPAISLEFIFGVPREGMKAGGIWPALVGTIYLVFLSLAVSAPVGILAAVYLKRPNPEPRGFLNAPSKIDLKTIQEKVGRPTPVFTGAPIMQPMPGG